ncbi:MULTISPECIES: archease [unclassified Archaeoglobus]|jgi:SHS2 domain-containing protein|uniref:archease n=1 Tax=unclassified Archaeoglobus TaxID=2643606 RepID=UPI0025C73BE1|nr:MULTISPECIES: archease [unclassified Archaeoglobus]
MKYRFIDHTADIAFEVYGSSLAELLKNAGLAFYDSFVDLSKIDGYKEVKIEVEGEDEEILLYRWLNELLYLFDTQFFAAKDVEVEVRGNDVKKAAGKLKGGKFTPENVKVEPKAITMHKFRVEKTPEGLKAFVVVDI